MAKVGFVAQDTPTYAGLSIDEHLQFGAQLNPGWDDDLARDRIARLGLDGAQRARKLSGGQRAQLALTLGLAKRPELLILDEPVASLDPLARREFLQDLMEAVAEHELSVVLSSHLVSDLERVCDYLVVLVGSRVQLAGDLDTLQATHHRLTGPRRDEDSLPGRPARHHRHPHRPPEHVHRAHRRADPRSRLDGLPAHPRGPRPRLHGPDRRPSPTARPGGRPMIWLTWRQSRAQVASVYGAIAAVLLFLAITAAQLPAFDDLYLQRVNSDGFANAMFLLASFAVLFVPGIVGVFWGAPLVARELEAGTHRLAWSQSISRTRWLAVKLAVTGATAAVVAGVASLALTWWGGSLDRAINAGQTIDNPLGVARDRARAVRTRGIAPIGYALFALALGVAVGIVVRRVVPAMAITLAIFIAVQIGMGMFVREHLGPTRLAAPITQQTMVGLMVGITRSGEPAGPVRDLRVDFEKPGAWIISNVTVDPAGRVLKDLPAGSGSARRRRSSRCPARR